MRKTSVFRQIFKEIHKRRCRRLPAAVLSGALLLGLAGAGSFFSPAATVQASPVENEETNPDGSGDAAASGEELTPEEQLQQELDQVYAMEVQSNGWEGGLACRPGDLRRGGHCHGGGHRDDPLCKKY